MKHTSLGNISIICKNFFVISEGSKQHISFQKHLKKEAVFF